MANNQDYPKLLSKDGYLSGVIFRGASGQEIYKTFDEYASLVRNEEITETHIVEAVRKIYDADLSLRPFSH